MEQMIQIPGDLRNCHKLITKTRPARIQSAMIIDPSSRSNQTYPILTRQCKFGKPNAMVKRMFCQE
jgi:hypothetical protein